MLDKGSSTLQVRTKIAKIRPPFHLHTIAHILLDPSLCIHTFYIFTLPLQINFYSDSNFRHSKFLDNFHFYLSLRLNFTKPISIRYLWFLFRVRLHFSIHNNKWQCNSFFCTKKKGLRFCGPKNFFFAYICNLEPPLSLVHNHMHLA